MEGSRENVADKSLSHGHSFLNNTVHLREMCPSDIDQIMAIERASFSCPWSARFFLEEIGVSYSKSLLAEVGGRVVGYLVYWQLPIGVDIHNLAVHPEFRRQGIGRYLLATMIRSASDRGSKNVTLEVRKSNTLAQKLYFSLDFTVKGVRRGYYSDDGEDAVVMALDLE